MPISPAPWILDGLHEDEFGKFYLVLSQGAVVARVYDGQQGHANARLITASPELQHAARRAFNVLKAQGESVRHGNVLGALDNALIRSSEI